MAISIDDIKALRAKTLAGISHCKKALEETNGNFEEAEAYLKKKGLLIASNKSDRETSEGLIGVSIRDGYGVILELNSETDFVAKNEKFQSLLNNIIEVAHANHPTTLDAFKALPMGQSSVAEEIAQHIAIIGENIQLSRMATMTVEKGVIASYVHAACVPGMGKVAAMVSLEADISDNSKLQELGKNIAMHIVASKPLAISVEKLDPQLVAKEKALIEEQLQSSNKPENVQQKIAEGKINKYYSEVVLLQQACVMDDKITISELIEKYSKELQTKIEISDYKLFALGDSK